MLRHIYRYTSSYGEVLYLEDIVPQTPFEDVLKEYEIALPGDKDHEYGLTRTDFLELEELPQDVNGNLITVGEVFLCEDQLGNRILMEAEYLEEETIKDIGLSNPYHDIIMFIPINRTINMMPVPLSVVSNLYPGSKRINNFDEVAYLAELETLEMDMDN